MRERLTSAAMANSENGGEVRGAAAKGVETSAAEKGRELTVLELHEGPGLERSALERDEELWGRICGTCPGAAGSRVGEEGQGTLSAILLFGSEVGVAEAVAGLWRLRLNGVHRFTPQVASCKRETKSRIDERVREEFAAHLLELRFGAQMAEFAEEQSALRLELEASYPKRRRFRKLREHSELQAKRQDLSFQAEQIRLRVKEFEEGLASLSMAVTGVTDKAGEVFVLGPDVGWCRLQSLLERECERLRAKLPLYGRRSSILSRVCAHQVTVLVGETGSGKSTQLVQYLADAGYADGGRIVCTQPRKVAAMALAARVREEAEGCLPSACTVGCVASIGQSHGGWAGITFATDFVLLHLCLTDPLLSKVSCVVVDEAHERSLNTDLLLALLKCCVAKRPDLKVIIMSATADASLLSSYFGVDGVLRIPGRQFPVHIVYEEKAPEVDAWMMREGPLTKKADAGAGWRIREGEENGYTKEVIQKVREIHETEKSGSILAFLTSPSEVDWACRQDFGSSALALPFYGKLPTEELQRVFEQNSSGKRRIVFATNFAETSLTIPDVRFVVDCGLAKDSLFDPQTGMNVLRVGRIDQSSAIQRAGRAGRTQAGVCYRLYSQAGFGELASHRLPEIKRVHLGLAILKLVGLGISRPSEFDFVEAPERQAILLALQCLSQLGAVKECISGEHSLTPLGGRLVKLGLEPRLGKFLLDSVGQGYGRDGLVIAAVMSAGRGIFYRSGSEDMKGRADSLKMRFCHPHGDLFTLLSVYQEWDAVPERWRNRWCVNNSVSAKTLRKCRDQVNDMNACLKLELNLRVPSWWGWSPASPPELSAPLRKIIFSALSSNLAVYSGHPRVGYDVVYIQQEAHLHPSSAVLVYGTMPEFVVYGELLHTSSTFLTLVTVVDRDWVMAQSPPPAIDLEQSALRKWVVPLPSSSLFARVCGKQGRNVTLLAQKIRKVRGQRCIIDQCSETDTLSVFTTAAQMAEARRLVERCVARERRWLDKECVEKTLVAADSCRQVASPSLLLGGGAQVMDVLMPGDYAAIEVSYECAAVWDEACDEEMLELFEQCGDGVFGYDKFPAAPAGAAQRRKWGIVRFCSKTSAKMAFQLLCASVIGEAVIHLRELTSTDNRPPFPTVKATLAWARRPRKGYATVVCPSEDKERLISALDNNEVCGSFVTTASANLRPNAVFIAGLSGSVDERALEDAVFRLCGVKIRDIVRGRGRAPALQPSVGEVHGILTAQIARFVPEGKFHVTAYPPRERDSFARADIRFDAGAHAEGAQALKSLEGFVLPGCRHWQTISHQRLFSASVHCSRLVFGVVKEDLEDLMTALRAHHENTRIFVVASTERWFHRVHIACPSLAVAAGCKSAIEKLVEGLVVVDSDDGQSTMRLLFTKRGACLANAVETRTRTLVLCDKRTRTAKIYGPQDRKAAALEQLQRGLAKLHSDFKCRQVVLRGDGVPAGLMREVVKLYGADLRRLEELAGAGVSIAMDHRRHLLSVEGGGLDSVMKVQKAVAQVAESLGPQLSGGCGGAAAAAAAVGANPWEAECPICFCSMERPHFLDGCGHGFCRTCLVDQINASVRHRDGFPLTCAHVGCAQVFLLTDIRALLTAEQQDDLLSASLSAFVAQSQGAFRYCTTPDCPNVYEVAAGEGNSFVCAACSVHLCTECHIEYHDGLSCQEYRQFKVDPDISLHAWRRGKDKSVKNCPSCTSVIEKIEGCNHMLCKCGVHVCWVCLATFEDSGYCYEHLRALHSGIHDDDDFER